jgi:glutamate-5-semialdehyde dehydrogenase
MPVVSSSSLAAEGLDLERYAAHVASTAQAAARELATSSGATRNRWLCRVREMLVEREGCLVAANEADVRAAADAKLGAAAIERLRVTGSRIDNMVQALTDLARLPDPIGEIIEGGTRPNGLEIRKVRVPLGVVFFIFESRPNVTVDASAICVKSGNAVILRGGKEALQTNLALYQILRAALVECGLPEGAVQLIETTDRAAVGHFLRMRDKISVTIPRGGRSLIERVVAEATMPVIKHFDGICHVYVDRAADLEMARRIVVNAKCDRPGVCNAAECLLVHHEIASSFLPQVAADLVARGVELRCCERTRRLVPESRIATEDDYRTEYLDLILSVRVVDCLEQAISHIESYGSHHTDAIVTGDLEAARRFTAGVDSAAVMVNASTRFNDGGEFGMGAEIGISTDKLHARGPCGLRELTSYKFVVVGDGQIRT